MNLPRGFKFRIENVTYIRIIAWIVLQQGLSSSKFISKELTKTRNILTHEWALFVQYKMKEVGVISNLLQLLGEGEITVSIITSFTY